MSTPDICRKLRAELEIGITTEIQVVYLLAGVRKLIERDQLHDKYLALKFHCNWALHAKLDRDRAKSVLKQFDVAHALLKENVELHRLPKQLRSEIARTSKMLPFEEELSQFLEVYNLPPLTLHCSDGWAHFLNLYARVIEDVPLVVSVPTENKKKVKQSIVDSPPKHISYVTVNCELARETIKHTDGEEVLFKVTWEIHDKNGQSGSIFIINSFSSHLGQRQEAISS
jgi:hypothetical protein